MCGKGKSREETKKYCMSLLFRCSHSRLILSGGGAAWPWAGPGGQCRHPGGRDGALRAAGTPLRPARLCVQELRLLLASAARRACRAARPCSYAEERAAGDVRHCPACRACAFCSAECAAAAALGGAAHSPEVCLGLQHLPSLQLDAEVRRSSCYTPAWLRSGFSRSTWRALCCSPTARRRLAAWRLCVGPGLASARHSGLHRPPSPDCCSSPLLLAARQRLTFSSLPCCTRCCTPCS